MSNPRLVKFWVEMDRVKKNFHADGFVFGFYVIDPQNNVAEIDGDTNLKRLLFEASPLINAKWKNEKEKTRVASYENRPEGTTCWLPHLPPGGINAMTDRVLKSYWSLVMRAVLPDRRSNLGYDNTRFVCNQQRVLQNNYSCLPIYRIQE